MDENQVIPAAKHIQRARTRASRPAPAPAPVVAEPSWLRADLEAVWAIGAPEGPGASVDAVLTFAATVLQEAAAEADGAGLAEEASSVVALAGEIAQLGEDATRRALFRNASRRLALLVRDPAATLEAELRLLVAIAPVAAASVWLKAADGTLQLAAASGPLAATR